MSRTSLRVAINAQLPPGAAGGTEQNLLRLVHSLIDNGGDETLLLVGPGEQSDWLSAHVRGRHRVLKGSMTAAPQAKRRGVRERIKSLFRRPPPAPKSSCPEPRKLLRDEQAHVVHFPYQTHYSVDAPFIFEPWDLQHLHLPEFFTPEEIERRERVYRTGCEQAALVVTATEWTKQDIITRYGVPAEKIAVIRRGSFDSRQSRMSPEEAAPILAPLNLRDDYLFFCAKDFPHKNHLRLFEAVAKVRNRGIDANLVCCGRVLDRNKPIWGARLRELGIDQHVRLLGRVEDEIIAALFARAKALVFPSLFEGLGIPILEAMEAGLPVVTTRASCIPEVAADAAIYADGFSSDSLADAIAVLYTEPERVSRLQARGIELVRQYDWTETARGFLACYRALSGVGASDADRTLYHSLIHSSAA